MYLCVWRTFPCSHTRPRPPARPLSTPLFWTSTPPHRFLSNHKCNPRHYFRQLACARINSEEGQAYLKVGEG
mgnify:CR=1 FL=1